MDTSGSWVAASRDELLAGAEERVVVSPGDGKSGSEFELVTIDGQRYFAKTLGYRTDWIMRVTGDRDLRTLKIWRAGIMSGVPEEIDHAVVGMAADGENEDALITILIRDVGPHLIPEGDAVVSLETHLGLLDGLAALSARYWDWRDDIELTTVEERLRFFAPDNIAAEAAVPDPPAPIAVAVLGWPRLAQSSPALGELLGAIHAAPTPLADAMRATPSTFLHGDWKMGNLGMHPDGRTILLDWAYPGAGPVCWDLAWYLALNCRRLPITKEATIEAFRDALERRGVPTGGWFDLQLDLCLLGMTVCFGWEKAMSDADELAWWERAAINGAASRPRPIPGTRWLTLGSGERGDVDDRPHERRHVVAEERRRRALPSASCVARRERLDEPCGVRHAEPPFHEMGHGELRKGHAHGLDCHRAEPGGRRCRSRPVDCGQLGHRAPLEVEVEAGRRPADLAQRFLGCVLHRMRVVLGVRRSEHRSARRGDPPSLAQRGHRIIEMVVAIGRDDAAQGRAGEGEARGVGHDRRRPRGMLDREHARRDVGAITRAPAASAAREATPVPAPTSHTRRPASGTGDADTSASASRA